MTPFTDDPSHSPTVVFPNPGMQSLSSVIHLLGVSVLGYCFARRTTFVDLSWGQLWSTITWPRLCVILVLADSWVFVFLSGVLVLGTGLSKDTMHCSLGIYACIALYVLSKILTYGFLIEKVHVVWGGTHQPRLKSPVYRICLITLTPYAVVIVLMLVGRIAFIRPDGACVIGLERLASLTLLTYDLYINIFLTGLFLWPLARSKLINPRLKSVAIRTLAAAFAALTTSTLNIAILTVMDGKQLGWVCLGSCGTDVTINAIVLFWVTSPNSSASIAQTVAQPTANVNSIPHDGNQAPPFVSQGRAPPRPGSAHRGPTAVVLSSVPRSPGAPSTPTIYEKGFGHDFLSPSTWKNKFGSPGGKHPGLDTEIRDGQYMEMSQRSPVARREVWDDRSSFLVMGGDAEVSSPRAVIIGAPPASKKRTSGRPRANVVNGVEVPPRSESRTSIFGRLFGSSDAREQDLEVTVTITTQIDILEDLEGDHRRSTDETSTAGGSAIKLDGIDGNSTSESLNLTKS